MLTQLLADVRSVNLELGEAERRHDVDFLREALHDGLVFRRADGSVVTKDQYLRDLPNRTYDRLESRVVQLEEKGTSAVATVVVTAEGTSHGKPFSGIFRNTRLFVEEGGRWQCLAWMNTRIMAEVSTLHHVSLPVTNLERSRRFYQEVLGLREIERPPFDFEGAWFELGHGQLHLIVSDRPERATFRGAKGIDSRDVHFAVRVGSFRRALEFLGAAGYEEKAGSADPKGMKVSPTATAGFPQIYVLDPDRHVIEINAERLDTGQSAERG